jgi:hypothetical protein
VDLDEETGRKCSGEQCFPRSKHSISPLNRAENPSLVMMYIGCVYPLAYLNIFKKLWCHFVVVKYKSWERFVAQIEFSYQSRQQFLLKAQHAD